MSDFSGYANYEEMPSEYDESEENIKHNRWFEDYICQLSELEMDGYVVKLTPKNADFINKKCEEDDDYSFSFTKLIFQYYGGGSSFQQDNPEAVLALVRMIDLENSTNKWRMKGKYRQTLKNIVEYVTDHSTGFWKKLLEKSPNPVLVENVSEAAYDKGKGVKDSSLSSKVCAYLNRLYGHDDFYINDAVIRRVLPYYLHYYRVDVDIDSCIVKRKTRKEGQKAEKKKAGPDSYYYDLSKLSYSQLFECLDALKKKVDRHNEITKEKFDRLMWYCYRKEKLS